MRVLVAGGSGVVRQRPVPLHGGRGRLATGLLDVLDEVAVVATQGRCRFSTAKARKQLGCTLRGHSWCPGGEGLS